MGSRSPLTSYEDALQAILGLATPLPPEQVPLTALHGRVLAKPVVCAHEMPFFSSSAMDGYGLTNDDVEALGSDRGRRFRVIGEVRAGQDPALTPVEIGAAVRIYTGAGVPEGVAAVVPQEDTHVDDGLLCVDAAVRPGQHIRPRGEEFAVGDVVAPAGTVATPGVVAALAAAGDAAAMVARRPAVGLLVTGDELVEPGQPLRPGAIYESNSFGVAAALSAMGIELEVRRVSDDAGATRAALGDMLDRLDVVLTSGGVSVGDYDVVRPELEGLGVRTLVWGVAIKPGKPFYLGVRDRAAVFGLPGNPVAAIVTLYALVRPYLLAAQGVDGRPTVVRADLTAALRKKPGRMEFVPCALENGKADPVVKRGSHMLGTLVSTNALVLFPRDASALEAGSQVEVMPVDWRVR